MTSATLHPDEIHSDETLVRHLLTAQFPHWADLPIVQFTHAGTDNAMYRLGDHLVARLPRRPSAAAPLAKELTWLPRIAPDLPLGVPLPIAAGSPSEAFPWQWSVCQWLDGVCPVAGQVTDPLQLAKDLARFILDLREIDTADAPPPGAHNFWRGVPLAKRDAFTRRAIAEVSDEFDTNALVSVWEDALNAPNWDHPPTWIHGDLSAGNLLMTNHRLSAVIDFGGLAIGDPACDLAVAWSLFEGESRETFRAANAIGDPAWSRGRGWALSIALIQLPYYRDTSPQIAKSSRAVIRAVLADSRVS